MNENKGRVAEWFKVNGVCTPGGDPYYECSLCRKYGRCYGIEHLEPMPKTCPICGATMKESD